LYVLTRILTNKYMIKNLLATAVLIIGTFVSSITMAQSTVTIQVGPGGSNTYSPANVTVAVGDTIKFVWVSGFHPTQSNDLTTIPLVNMDGTGGVNSIYKIKMLTAGSFPYVCTAHGGMGGTITVNAPFVPTNTIAFSGTGALTSNNWSTHSGTTGQILNLTTASDNGNSLSYSGMPASTGNRTQIIAGNSEDINRLVPIISSGSVYMSALIKLPNTLGQAANSTTGNYFLHLTDSSGTIVPGHGARLSVRLGSVPNTFNLGIINHSGGTASTALQIFGATPIDYSINQTYLVVVKYTFATNTASLFVNPIISSTEPSALVVNAVGTSALLKVKSVCIREAGNASAGTGNIEIDEIRVTNNWNDVLGVVPSPTVKFNPTILTVNENAGTATVTLNITNPNSSATSATVLVKGGTATAGSDYTFTSQTVTFPANSSTAQTFTFPIIDDVTQEADETITLAIRSATNSAVIDADSVLTITIPANDIVNPVVKFNPTTVSVNENAGTATVTLNITNPNASATSVDVKVKGGTATSVSDYTFTTQTVTFPANSSTAQTFTIPIIDDATQEGDETIILALRNSTNSSSIGVDSIFTITILANDIPPTVSFAAPLSATVNEGANQIININITNPNTNPSTVKLYVKSTSSASGSDYSGVTSGATYTFPANSSTSLIDTVNITDDILAENGETVVLVLRDATNSAIIGADSIITITIPINDQPINNIPLLTENFNYNLNDTLTKTPGTGWGIVSASLTNRIPVTAGLSYATSSVSNIGGAAQVKNTGEDIGKAITGSNIRYGTFYSSFLINVTAANATGDYFFSMLDSALSGLNYRARTFIKSSGSGFRIGVSKSSSAATSAGFNSTDLLFGTTYQIVVKYSIISGTGNDSVKLFVNPVLGSSEPVATASAVTTESDITINATTGLGGIAIRQGSSASAPTLIVDGIIVGQTWAAVTPLAVVNPSVKMNPTTVTVNESAGTATVTLNVTNPNASATSVDVKIKGGTATAGTDYTFTTQTVTFPANSTTAQSFTIPIIDDTNQENDETIVLALRNSTNSSTIEADSILTITIPANDITNPVMNFVGPFTVTNAEGTNYTYNVAITNPSLNATNIKVYVKSTSTAAGTDYTGIDGLGKTLTFPSNSSANQSENVAIVDDAIAENGETIVLVLRDATNSGVIGNDSLLTIIIPQNDQPLVAHFVNVAGNVNENAGTAAVSVMAMGATTNGATSFDVLVKGGSAVAGSDYSFTTQTVTIPGGKDSTVVFNIPIVNDNVFEIDETVIFTIRNITNAGVISTDSNYTLTIKNDDIQYKNISALRVNDVNGVSVLKDTLVYIKGIVYGVDMQGSATSLQYTLIDPTGGVGIFRAGASTPPIISLVPEEGDSVKVYGKVGEFNGLTQVNMDSIILISKANALRKPRVFTKLDESTESNLVVYKNAEILDTLANSASGTTLRISNGVDSIDLRIDADVSLFAQPITGRFDVIGLGGQFDASNPKNSGYQLLPRSINDIIPVVVIVPTVNIDSALYHTKEGAGTVTVKVSLSSAATEAGSVTFALTGGSAIFNSDFTFGNPGTLNFAVGATEATVTFTITDDAVVENNETINFAISDAVKCVLGTTTSSSIQIRDNDKLGLNNNKSVNFNVYPNPADQQVNIIANDAIQAISIVNIIGQTVVSLESLNTLKQTIDISTLSPGVYNIVLISENGSSTKRIVIK
jgi:plastocyanin